MKFFLVLIFLLGSFSSFASDKIIIKKGIRVVYDGSLGTTYTGSVLEIFNNGKVRISPDGFFSTSSVQLTKSEIGIGFRCSGNLCVGDRVSFKGNLGDYSGTVLEIFNNGKVSISPDGFFSPSSVYRTVTELGYESNFYN
ncbi:MAG: hypothetical protein PHY93_03945 [Bacteriovorax sp.]|nr:hypothetical protein [Bacteriovorax sp.]